MNPHQPLTHCQQGTTLRPSPEVVECGLVGDALAAVRESCAQHTCLQGPAVESLPTSYLDINQSSPSSGTHTPAPFCENASPDCESSKAMLDPWTSQQSWLESMRYALDSLVRISAQQDTAQESQENDLDSIGKSCVQSILFDLPGCSLKTAQESEPKADTSSSVTLWRVDIPGEMESCPRLMLERHTSATGGGVLRNVPTPTVSQAVQVRGMGAAAMAPQRGTTLAGWVKIWPTPIASDWKSHSPAKKATNSLPLREQVGTSDGGAMNPEWVEWLMGWPIGHTELSALGTVKFRSARLSRGACSEGRK